ncbi:hypothetical protein HPP92_020431 [Vanilla planifolia]|uniref:Uncharacterized protein n=1 Tax=Vanilla planifolia TaxID=51239 RepID=A0A835Q0G2_VANPL|nr:hypothetical protein HPP92_020431 [Vanilla planifolia]
MPSRGRWKANAPPKFKFSRKVSSSQLNPISGPNVADDVLERVSLYARAKKIQMVEKEPAKAIPLFWAAINAGDRVDSALKDMTILMQQLNRAAEAIEAIKSLRFLCSHQSQESLDNILLDLYMRCGRLDEHIALLRHKLFVLLQGLAFNGKRTKIGRSHGRKIQVSVPQEERRLLGNLGWALMLKGDYAEAAVSYKRALFMGHDNNMVCNLGFSLARQGRVAEAIEAFKKVGPTMPGGGTNLRSKNVDLRAFETAHGMLQRLKSLILPAPSMTVEKNNIEMASLFNEDKEEIFLQLPNNEEFEQTVMAAAILTPVVKDEIGSEW